MRRILLALPVFVLGLATLAGCCHTHGICDTYQINPCVTRNPWLMHMGAVVEDAGPGPDTGKEPPRPEGKKL